MMPRTTPRFAADVPLASIALVVACAWMQVWLATLGPLLTARALYAGGLIPAVMTRRAMLPPDLALLAPPWTFLSSLVLHAEWTVWAVNLAGLALFGPLLEGAMRRRHAALFYLMCGLSGGLASIVYAAHSAVPVIGVGAVVAGAAAATVLLRPRSRMAAYAAAWLAVSALLAMTRAAEVPGLGLPALLAGALTGAALLPCLKHRELPLLRV